MATVTLKNGSRVPTKKTFDNYVKGRVGRWDKMESALLYGVYHAVRYSNVEPLKQFFEPAIGAKGKIIGDEVYAKRFVETYTHGLIVEPTGNVKLRRGRGNKKLPVGFKTLDSDGKTLIKGGQFDGFPQTLKAFVMTAKEEKKEENKEEENKPEAPEENAPAPEASQPEASQPPKLGDNATLYEVSALLDELADSVNAGKFDASEKSVTLALASLGKLRNALDVKLDILTSEADASEQTSEADA